MRVESRENNDESEKQQRSLATRTVTNKNCNEKIATNDKKNVARTKQREATRWQKSENSYEKMSSHSDEKKQRKKTTIRCNENNSEKLERQREITKLYFYPSSSKFYEI